MLAWACQKITPPASQAHHATTQHACNQSRIPPAVCYEPQRIQLYSCKGYGPCGAKHSGNSSRRRVFAPIASAP
eukprot:6782912-Prymnesium_polylepis.1